MKATAEDFKGITYVRISDLPKAQRDEVESTISSKLIIKILKEGEVLHDCLQYDHYQAWYENTYRANATRERTIELEVPSKKWAVASLINLF